MTPRRESFPRVPCRVLVVLAVADQLAGGVPAAAMAEVSVSNLGLQGGKRRSRGGPCFADVDLEAMATVWRQRSPL